MNYTLNQLQVYLKVVQTQSVTKAAEALNLSQPAVSIQLKNFQDQFGIPLIEVIGRKVYITDFGKEIAVAAENIINQVYAINYKSLAYKNQLSGRLKIASVSTGKYLMPFFLSGFMRQHAGVELVMDVTNKNKVFESLKNNEIDFGLVSFLPPLLDIDKLDLLDDKFINQKDIDDESGYKPKQFFPSNPYDPLAGLCNVMLELDANGTYQMFTEEREVFDDQTVVEFRYDITKPGMWKWIPMRIRYDKTADFKSNDNE